MPFPSIRILWLALFVLIPLGALWLPALLWLVGLFITTSLSWDLHRLTGIAIQTVLQAGASTLFCIGLGFPIALALFRRDFFAKRFFYSLISMCFILPPILVAYAIVALWGRNGIVAQVWDWFSDTPWFSPFGLGGIILAHAMLNLPFAIRIFILQLEQQPRTIWQTAYELNLSPRAMFVLLDFPFLKNHVVSSARLIFLYCFQSFAIVWLMGGGPGQTNFEVALFSALRYEADFAFALQIILTQALLITGLVSLPGFGFTKASILDLPQGQNVIVRPDANHALTKIFDVVILLLAFVVILAPLLALILRFVSDEQSLFSILFTSRFIHALIGSLTLAFPAACLGCVLSLGLTSMIALSSPRWSYLLSRLPMLIFMIPLIALGSSWIILGFNILPDTAFIFIMILALCVAILPIGVNLLIAPMQVWWQSIIPQAQELNLSRWLVLRQIAPAYLGAPLRQLFIWGLAFSIGDLGLTALFGYEIIATLPLYMQQLFASYHTHDGQSVAIWMLCLYALFHFALYGKRPPSS